MEELWRKMNKKREEYISWDSYFMGLAAVASFRSKDPSTQNGACIVDPISKSPISLGYNGFVRTNNSGVEGIVEANDEIFPWTRDAKEEYNCKYPFVVHAESNSIYNAARKGISLDGAVMYLYSEKGYYPCSSCAQAIIQSGIKEVIMAYAIKTNTDKYDWTPTKKMFNAAGIRLTILDEKIDDRKVSEYPVKISERLIIDFELMAKKMKEIAEKVNYPSLKGEACVVIHNE